MSFQGFQETPRLSTGLVEIPTNTFSNPWDSLESVKSPSNQMEEMANNHATSTFSDSFYNSSSVDNYTNIIAAGSESSLHQTGITDPWTPSFPLRSSTINSFPKLDTSDISNEVKALVVEEEVENDDIIDVFLR
jgi:hypothetical protein